VNEVANNRFRLAQIALEGLSVGDAFGQQFFGDQDEVMNRIVARELPQAPWWFTDDTLMAISVCEILGRCGRIEQDELANSFCARFQPDRGYGATMRRLLTQLVNGQNWREAAGNLFSGIGSHGNGAAMRVAPIGAYFHDDLDRVIEEARLSAVVTHTHPEGVAGAIAIALASALAVRIGLGEASERVDRFLIPIAERLPKGAVRNRIEVAASLPDNASVQLAVSALGNGIELSAVDTVPLALWVASRRMDNFEEAIWETVSALGDRDTTCAMVGAIVALSDGMESIPIQWRQNREPLPAVD
jgi:ADP-ribosylglycohydrolase